MRATAVAVAFMLTVSSSVARADGVAADAGSGIGATLNSFGGLSSLSAGVAGMTAGAVGDVGTGLGAAAANTNWSSSEKEEAARADGFCLIQRAQELDDGISDASSVAKAVSAACIKTLAQAREAYVRGLSDPKFKVDVYNTIAQGHEEGAVHAVLAVRAQRRRAADQQ